MPRSIRYCGRSGATVCCGFRTGDAAAQGDNCGSAFGDDASGIGGDGGSGGSGGNGGNGGNGGGEGGGDCGAGTVDLMKPHLYEKRLEFFICNGVLS